VHVESSRLARVRSLELTPALAGVTAGLLYVITVTGALVRLTDSGLGCEGWPGCQAGAFFPPADHHAVIEFGNRFVGLVTIVSTLVAWLAARRTPGLPRWAALTAMGTFLGTIAQAPLGRLTITFDLHPLLVMAHFLLALVVLGGAIVVALEAWGLRHGHAAPLVPSELRRAGVVLVTACLALVVTGTFATAAGPHSGGGEEIPRLGSLPDALYVHVRGTAVFGCVFLFMLGYLAARRARSPRLFAFALALLALVLVQMGVGELQWRTELPWGIVLLHVALAAAIWVATVALATLFWRPLRLFQPPSPPLH
jgi:cytochrome c oxidase assembly protein subunit 15